MRAEIPTGLILLPERLDAAAQQALAAEVEAGLARAPLYVPRMPRTGKPMSVRMSNFGSLGWYTDPAAGYRYVARHPETNAPWPPIPSVLIALWEQICDYRAAPEACLVNFYGEGARMGLHVDADEAALDAPVLSVSLGDTAIFRIGGPNRNDPTSSIRLRSGDVMALTGPARRCRHGIDRVLSGSSRLLTGGGRLNLTLRRVTLPD